MDNVSSLLGLTMRLLKHANLLRRGPFDGYQYTSRRWSCCNGREQGGSRWTASTKSRWDELHRSMIRASAFLPQEWIASAPGHIISINFPRRLFSTSLSEEERATVDHLAADILSGGGDGSDTYSQRIALSKAITLVESKSEKKRLLADSLLEKLRHANNLQRSSSSSPPPSFRLGIAGPPGVGKSSFVETLGLYILGLSDVEQDQKTKQQKESSFQPDKLAVLCIDPSSHVTGGSILGDKTRMSHLSYNPRAYIRPSPSSGTLGGLGSYTYDAASLCELAGYQLTIIETVGVGQSEVELAECCDLFLLLLAPGGGDELQGSKKGIVEVADVLVVNKADGDTQSLARQTANEYRKAMGMLRKPAGWWSGVNQNGKDDENTACETPAAPPVLLVSAKTGYGIPELWKTIVNYQKYAQSSDYHREKRRLQNRYWMWKYLRQRVFDTAENDPLVKKKSEEIQMSLDSGLVAPRVAAGQLWKHIVRTRGP